MLLPNPLNPLDTIARFIALQQARDTKHPWRPKHHESALIQIDREVVRLAWLRVACGEQFAPHTACAIGALNTIRRSLLGIAPIEARRPRWQVAA